MLSILLFSVIISQTATRVLLVGEVQGGVHSFGLFPSAETNLFKVVRFPPFSTACLTSQKVPTWALWVQSLAFESAAFGLAMFKVFQTARETWRTPKVLIVLLRDSVVYFGGIFAILCTNMIVTTTARVRESSSWLSQI